MKLLNFKKRLAAALVAAGAMLPQFVLAAPLRTNLVVNPGFEAVDVGDPGPFTSVRLLDWIDSDGDLDDNFAFPYSSNYTSTPLPPGAGSYYFTGGFNMQPGMLTIEQTFDVSAGPSGALIATGTARYDLRGFFTSYYEQDDVSLVRASFRNASNAEIGSAEMGGLPFLNGVPLRAGQRMWGNDAKFGVLPVGTASVRIEVSGSNDSVNHDGYVDLVDFRVGGLTDDVALKLEVNSANGSTRLRNLTGSVVDMNYYEITSASGSINLGGWNSLQDQDFEGSGGTSGTGDGWEEGGGASANGVGELFLLGSSQLANNQRVSLGNLFRPSGGTRDLTMRYGLESGLLLYGYVDFLPNFGVSGDFNNNGLYQCSDVDALTAAIAAGTNNPSFDLTGDGLVNLVDLNAWLVEAGNVNLPSHNPYRPGDANLSGAVDGSDFGIWNANKFTNTSAWCSGNFNGGSVVDGSDFGIWNANKFTSSDAISAVPEPTGLGVWWSLVVFAPGFLRRRGA